MTYVVQEPYLVQMETFFSFNAQDIHELDEVSMSGAD